MGTVEETAEAIRTMNIRGAAAIALAASDALAEVAKAHEGDDPARLAEELGAARARLMDTRPTAVSLRNGLAATLKGVMTAGDVVSMKERLLRNHDEFSERARRAKELIGLMCANRIRDGDVVITHCNSQMALAGIVEAHRQGKKLRVFATESRPRRQGLLTVRQLADAGVDVTLMVDSAVRHHMGQAGIVVVGADAIATNGAVINKIGTSQVALAASEARVPVVVCAESFKFSPLTLYGNLVEIEERDPAEVADPAGLPGVRISNPVFDATPPEYIDVIVTELGVIPPTAAYEIIVQQFGYEALRETG